MFFFIYRINLVKNKKNIIMYPGVHYKIEYFNNQKKKFSHNNPVKL